jgi:pSer/pThr/pTyr-binding forkhead associated (FHA) protein
LTPQHPLGPHSATPAELLERHEATQRGTPFLLLRETSGPQHLRPLDPSTRRLSIGRGAVNDIALTWDDRASRLHAELEFIGGVWVIIDDGLSTNGTWVGEDRVVGRRRLRDGDILRIGDTLIAFCAPGETRGGTALADDAGDAAQVTPAQRRVLVALCRPALVQGTVGVLPTNQELADELFLSVAAVKTHLQALFSAFGLDDVPNSQKRSSLVERAVRLGIVTARDVG